jgi:hypothetical protein
VSRATFGLARLALVAALVGALAAPGGPARASNAFYEELRAARALMARGDLPAARRGFARLDSIAGGLPSTTYSLAQIAGRLGKREEALRRLEAYAAMGLTRDAAGDSSFAALFDDPRFRTVVAALRANASPLSRATIAASLGDPALLTEDVAFDSLRNAFYVSSIHRGIVAVVDSSGIPHALTAAGAPGVWGIYGLAIDVRGGLLWGSTAATPTGPNYVLADSGRTAVVAWDLASGEVRVRAELPRDGAPHLLGDLARAPDGTIYATDAIGGGLYRLKPGAAALDTLAAPGTFASPQMPVVITPGKTLWISDYPRGIVAFDLARRTVRAVPKPRSLAASGIDGMALAPGGLVAVQNGMQPARVLYLSLDPARSRITGWNVLEQGSSLLGDPNHGIVAGDAFYCIGNSGWDRVNRNDELETPEGATSPLILRIPLPAPTPSARGH